ncbi:MAG: methylmalonyl Co-A mutase-associated GTPase MeaB [Thermoanaerobaculales bacterium]|jgi:LAO/AO transport system kinase|nr:methylmalonyl Co-A mutase-associated GTPase MeaB [Thermoanaerobaculales bacterium]
MKRTTTTDELLAGVRAGDRAALGRALTLVESSRPEHRERAQELLTTLLPDTGAAHRVGITGVPGVGKSTFIEAFGLRLVERGHRVAVLAVDPSSPVSKGSILGDKTRMERLAQSDAAFIRPSPAGGSLGGVARTTRESMLVCEAAGYDMVLVETVGVGQSETAVADMVDLFLLLSLAGAGDELQGIKRGILELADLIAINKADGDNLAAAERARTELASALRILRPAAGDRLNPRVVTCSAVTGAGLDAIHDLIVEHRAQLEASGALGRRRSAQQLRWMWSLVEEGLRTAVRERPELARRIEGLERAVVEGEVAATAAAEEILSAFRVGGRTSSR